MSRVRKNTKPRMRRNFTLKLPDEFLAVCAEDGIDPALADAGEGRPTSGTQVKT